MSPAVSTNQSVTKILFERYQVEARPGQKVDCPFCERHTFSVHKDDSIGKCFHPECGKFVRPESIGCQYRRRLRDFLETLYSGWRKELLAQADRPGKTAYSYLHEERGIHPQVISDAMLGAVPDHFTGIDPLVELEKEIAERYEALSDVKKPDERALAELEQILDAVRKVLVDLPKHARNYAGWLCFFCTDEHCNITSIKFRQPYAKRFALLQPFGWTGIFGVGMFSLGTTGGAGLHERMLVVEGEFNLLQLQSLAARCSERAGRIPVYQPACAMGSVNCADFMTLQKACRCPVIGYDHDPSGAGRKLVEGARDFMNLYAFTTPKPDSDLDQFIREFGADCDGAWSALKALVGGAEFYDRHFEPVAKEIFFCRKRKGIKEFEVNAEVSKVLIEDLSERAVLYYDQTDGYLFLKVEKSLIKLDPEDRCCRHLLARYGILAVENVADYVIAGLRIEVRKRGESITPHRAFFYDPGRFTLYLSNNEDQIYRITPEKIDLVDNGHDGVLFLKDPEAETFTLLDQTHVADVSLVDRLVLSKINFDPNDGLSVADKKILFLIWMLSLFFPQLMPTKVIPTMVGPKGSAKSFSLKKVGKIIFGAAFDVTPLPQKPDDFDATVSNSAFVVFDNVDGKCGWLPDKLATLATGGTLKKREYYTTNTMVSFRPCCTVGITTRTPEFRRDDVNDRLLILRTRRLDSFVSEQRLLAEVQEYRDELMTELVGHLQETVRALKAGEGADYSGSFRMADFADFAIKIGRHAGVESQVKAILTKLSREQSKFTLEMEPVARMLILWVQANPGKQTSNVDLCTDLARLARKKGVPFPYNEDQGAAFAQVMSHLRPNLEEFFTITPQAKGARKVLYSFALKPGAEDLLG